MSTPAPDPPATWSAVRLPPVGWDGRTAFLLRDGVMTLHGLTVRLYHFTDGQVLANAEDLLAVAFAVRAHRTGPPSSGSSLPGLPRPTS